MVTNEADEEKEATCKAAVGILASPRSRLRDRSVGNLTYFESLKEKNVQYEVGRDYVGT